MGMEARLSCRRRGNTAGRDPSWSLSELCFIAAAVGTLVQWQHNRYIDSSFVHNHDWKLCVVCADTRWFKYDRDYLCVNKSQFVPVIFEPPYIISTHCIHTYSSVDYILSSGCAKLKLPWTFGNLHTA
jgi:hypothetical protein